MTQAKKPIDFKKFETAAKAILEAEGENYHEWLHKLHTDKIHEVIANNPNSLANLIESQRGNS